MSITKKLIVVILLLLLALFSYSYFSFHVKTSTQDSLIKQDDRGMSVETFTQKVSNPNKLVLVYFHADWCVPCVKLKPEIAALETESKDICVVLKLDADDNPILSEHFEINTLPTFMLYKNGKKVWENNGYQSKQQLQAKIEAFGKN